MTRERAVSIVTGTAAFLKTVTWKEWQEAWQMLVNDETIWHMTHSEGYSLGRRASELMRKNIIRDKNV